MCAAAPLWAGIRILAGAARCVALIRSRVSGEIPDVTQTRLPPRAQRYSCRVLSLSDVRRLLSPAELALADY
jgi:hypothetical protein